MQCDINFSHVKLLKIIEDGYELDFYNGAHGVEHWKRVFANTRILSNHYKIKSPVFELFSILHDSKRENEHDDKYHGLRASTFVKELLSNNDISLSTIDSDRLIYACENHTYSDEKDPLFNDIIVQICFDSDRLDIDRVGYEINSYYLSTDYAKSLVLNGKRVENKDEE